MSKTHQEYKNIGYLEDQRDFFDKLITQDWETYQSTLWNRTRQFEVHQILRFIDRPLRRILDVGCGCGYHDLLFAQETEIESVVGIDYSPKSIEQAEKHYPHPKVWRYVGDIFLWEQIIRRFGQFDLVTSFQVIEHLKDPQAFLIACRQCAVDEGYVAVVTPNLDRLENRFRRLLGKKPAFMDPMHFTEYSVNDLITIGNRCGLQCVGRFAHSLSLPRIKIPFSVQMGSLFPNVANNIGIIFQKMGKDKQYG